MKCQSDLVVQKDNKQVNERQPTKTSNIKANGKEEQEKQRFYQWQSYIAEE